MDSRGLIWVALDTEWPQAIALATALKGHPAIAGFKLNRLVDALLYVRGRDYLHEIAQLGHDLWFDLKFIDIPETVAGRLEPHVKDGRATYFTVMAKGGAAMMRKAVEVGGPHSRMIAVTELTSLSNEEVQELSGKDTEYSVVDLAKLAAASGIQYVVCSGQEVAALKAEPDLDEVSVIVPATLPACARKAGDDQKRVVSTTDVCRAGDDMIAGLVFGRVFTEASDPRNIADQIAEEIEAVH